MQQAVAKLRILSRGLGPIGSFNLALVGSFCSPGNRWGTGATSSGVRAKNPAMKSSTMKGAKALGSKLSMETVPNVEKPSFLGKGTLLVSCPRNREQTLAETMACREAGAWSDGVEVVPPSYVTIRVKSSLIREGPLQPPVVRRCLVGNEVLQKQRTGRVVQVEAVALELRDMETNPLQGSGGIVPALGWHRARLGRRKNGRGNPTQQSTSPLVGDAPRGRGLRGHLRLARKSGSQVATSGEDRSCSLYANVFLKD